MQEQRLEWHRPKMDELFKKKTEYEAKGKNFNSSIQSGREYRNPRICEKLIENCNINQYGSNFSRDQFDPNSWKKNPNAFYDSKRYKKLMEQRAREKVSNG